MDAVREDMAVVEVTEEDAEYLGTNENPLWRPVKKGDDYGITGIHDILFRHFSSLR